MGNLTLVNNDLIKSRQIFDSLQNELARHLSEFNYRLEHIGSTAIPTALTKPVLDVLLIAEDENSQKEIATLLPNLGFTQGELDRKQTKLFFYKEISDPASFLNYIHLHLVFAGTENKNDLISLQVKEYLLTHPEEVESYNRNKEELAREGDNDRRYYVVHKEKFMNELLARMRDASSDRQ